MRALRVSLVLLMLAGIASAAGPVKGFLTDYQKAQTLAKKENKPLYLHFTTIWCSWCRRIENDIYKNAEGEKILAPFVKATLDCTVPDGEQPSGAVKANLQLMRKYGGEGFPFLVITTPEGDVLGRFSGYLPLPQFQAELDKALKVWDAQKGMEACKAKGDTRSLEYHKNCLAYFIASGDWAKAGAAADALAKLDPEGKKTDRATVRYAQLRAALLAKAKPEKITALRKAVAEVDPKNEKGYLEKAYLSEVTALMKAGQGEGEQEQQKTIKKMEVLLKQTIQAVPKLSNPMQVYGLLFQIQVRQGQYDQAIATLKELKSKAPEGADTRQIDQTIQKIQSLKKDLERAKTQPAAQPAATPKSAPPVEKKPAPKTK